MNKITTLKKLKFKIWVGGDINIKILFLPLTEKESYKFYFGILVYDLIRILQFKEAFKHSTQNFRRISNPSQSNIKNSREFKRKRFNKSENLEMHNGNFNNSR